MVEEEAEEEEVDGDEGEETMEEREKNEPLGDVVANDQLLSSLDFDGWDDRG